MKVYLPRTPDFIARIFSKYTWRFSSDKKEIYLTFDDGPTPEITNFVITELKKYNAKATFFCIGKNIQNHPEIFKRIIADEHSVGNHTQNHLNGWKSKNTIYIDDFLECDKLLQGSQKLIGLNENGKNTYKVLRTLQEKPKLFRPPYGKIKKSQAIEILKKGYKIIMWDVLSADFDTSISKEKCLQNVLKNTKNGSIIVFHDSIKASEKLRFVLPKFLKEFSEKGFSFKSI
ncbi:polysaccharide deacetylase family protein [Polaribacter cellanae]|uniref:Polysaccharide deacetylase family protein n=1 Tax=Polaribacter cellanae TaxID=2818493 RepID=A0A975CS67_9FLAO|nr:polysaccharide deacetylase family protein [Polaribacter cellanae]QTE24400.1 polysaccharide deacetylase family protein [Polaribacter cellanae]